MDSNLQKRMEVLFTVLHFECRQKHWQRINFLLSQLNNSVHPPILRIGALRATYSVKGVVPAWKDLRDSLVEELGSNHSHLRGLV